MFNSSTVFIKIQVSVINAVSLFRTIRQAYLSWTTSIFGLLNCRHIQLIKDMKICLDSKRAITKTFSKLTMKSIFGLLEAVKLIELLTAQLLFRTSSTLTSNLLMQVNLCIPSQPLLCRSRHYSMPSLEAESDPKLYILHIK